MGVEAIRFGKDGMGVLVNEVERSVTGVVVCGQRGGEHNAFHPESCFSLY